MAKTIKGSRGRLPARQAAASPGGAPFAVGGRWPAAIGSADIPGAFSRGAQAAAVAAAALPGPSASAHGPGPALGTCRLRQPPRRQRRQWGQGPAHDWRGDRPHRQRQRDRPRPAHRPAAGPHLFPGQGCRTAAADRRRRQRRGHRHQRLPQPDQRRRGGPDRPLPLPTGLRGGSDRRSRRHPGGGTLQYRQGHPRNRAICVAGVGAGGQGGAPLDQRGLEAQSPDPPGRGVLRPRRRLLQLRIQDFSSGAGRAGTQAAHGAENQRYRYRFPKSDHRYPASQPRSNRDLSPTHRWRQPGAPDPRAGLQGQPGGGQRHEFAEYLSHLSKILRWAANRPGLQPGGDHPDQ